MLSRHLQYLAQLGIGDVTIVTGFMRESIDDELARLGAAAEVSTIFNADFESGSIVSLAAARAVLQSGDEILLMDADVLYEPALLERLIGSVFHNCFLVDMDFEAGEEPVKLCLLDGTIVEFSKTPARGLKYDEQGESVGFFRFSPGMAAQLAALAQDRLQRGLINTPYEEAIRELVLANPGEFGFEDITGSPWVEIDFPADVLRAEHEVLPRFEQAAT